MARSSIGAAAIRVGLLAVCALQGRGDAAEPATPPGAAQGAHPTVRWEATGLFRLQRHEGRNWLVTPDGRPFFYLGINHIAAGLSPEQRTDVRLGADLADRLRAMCFNGAGYGPPPLVWEQMPFIALLNLTPNSRFLRDRVEFVDVFDPAFQESLRRRVAHQCRQFKDNPHLVGYMWTDTPMWDLDSARRLRSRDWVSTIRRLPAGAAGKHAYVDWLLERHGANLADIARVYGIEAASRDDLLEATFEDIALTDRTVRDDDEAFLGIIARALYGVAAAELRASDPDHLLLGEMYFQNDHPAAVLEQAAKHVDVLVIQPSINHRATRPADHFDRALFDELHERHGKPILIGDHQFAYITPQFPRTMWANYPSPREAAEAYAQFLASAMGTPYVIGYGRCQLRDAPQADGSLKQGLWNADGVPHPDFAPLMAEANRRALESLYAMLLQPQTRP